MENKPLAAVDYQTVEELLTDMVNGGKPLIEVIAPSIPWLTYLLFDTQELFSDETSRTIQLRMKNLGEGVTPVMVDEDCAVQRREKIRGWTKTTLAASASDTNIITVTDIAELKGIGVNTNIRIRSTAGLGSPTNPVILGAIITNITGNQITLDRPVTVAEGDELFRGKNNRNYCDPISNNYTLEEEGIYKSYFQSLQLSMDFKICDLNIDRLMYSYDMDVNSYIDSLRRENRQGFLRELVDTIYRGENVKGTAVTKQETRGIFTSIQEAQTVTSNQYIYDLIGCCGEDDDDMVIDTFVNILTSVFESGYYNQEPVTAVINNKQLSELMKMRASFLSYAGLQIFTETRASHPGMRDYVSLRALGMDIEHTYVEYILETGLNEYFPDNPIMLLMPKKMFGMYQKKYHRMTSDMRVQANSGVPTLEMKDITEFKSYLNGGDECFSYVGKLDFAIVLGGVYNGARRVIKNMYHYRSCNTQCNPAQGVMYVPGERIITS